MREVCCKANLDLIRTGLVTLSWGNASVLNREAGVMAIKPSGFDYDALQPRDIVVVSLETGEVLEGALKPSSDTPTHLHLYRSFPDVGAIVHTHSNYAVSWAQAEKEVPCLGTTHADHFKGAVPLTRQFKPEETASDYELNTGKIIVERFSQGISPADFPGVLVAGHGPFTWGATLRQAVENAVALEALSKMAYHTMMLNPGANMLPEHVLNKHFNRKWGPDAYYGQR